MAIVRGIVREVGKSRTTRVSAQRWYGSTEIVIQNEETKSNFHLWLFPRHSWMERFGIKIQSVRTIINYAKENMANGNIIDEVKECAKKMRDYMKDFDSENNL